MPPITLYEIDKFYVDQRPCAVCGKPTYRVGIEMGDEERGEQEPLVCNPCLISIRKDMYTEWELRGRVRELETMMKIYAPAFSFVFGILGVLVGLLLGGG